MRGHKKNPKKWKREQNKWSTGHRNEFAKDKCYHRPGESVRQETQGATKAIIQGPK